MIPTPTAITSPSSANRLEAAPELKAEVIDGRVQLTAPSPSEASATAIVRYEISDGRGGAAVGTLKIQVRKDAATLAPVARDDRVAFAETLGKAVVEVPVLKNDEDPDGVAAELKITFPEAAPTASISAPGKVSVRLESEPQIIAYTVTDVDKLSSTAFIVVPGLQGQAPALAQHRTAGSGQRTATDHEPAGPGGGPCRQEPPHHPGHQGPGGRLQWSAAGEGRDHHRVHFRRRLRRTGSSVPRGHRRRER